MFGGRKPPPSVPGTPQGTQTMPLSGSSSASGAPNAQSSRAPVGFETVLGANTMIKGELKSHANVRLDGTFEGSIEIDGNIMIGETARITANIHANNLTIAGGVRGDVIGNKVQVQRTGRVWGDISAVSIVTEEGAYIDGKITMTGHPASQGFDQAALPAPEMSLMHPSAEDAASGEPVEVEMMDDHPQQSLSAETHDS